MQHTEKYRFNLIETSDTFSPAALNENAQAVEAELTALTEATAAADAALARTAAENKAELLTAMGTHGKTARIAIGHYENVPARTGSLTVDFYPVVVFIKASIGQGHVLIRPDTLTISNELTYYDVTWGDRTVSWRPSRYDVNYSFFYVVLGVEDGG